MLGCEFSVVVVLTNLYATNIVFCFCALLYVAVMHCSPVFTGAHSDV